MAAQILPSVHLLVDLGYCLTYIYMVESTLERSHGLVKWLLAKTWLTKSCSSSKGGKVPSKSHRTTPNEDGQMDGGWFVALHPQGVCRGEHSTTLSFFPSRTDRVLCQA